MLDKKVLIPVGITLAVLAVLTNVRAARPVKRIVLG